MLILGIESSCDETAISLVEDGHKVLSSHISSQIDQHSAYGGVIPELAAREHLSNITPVLNLSLQEAGKSLEDIDGIAVTHQPGLLPALLVGTSFAKGLSASLNVPLTGVNHLVAHVYAGFIEEQHLLEKESYPLSALLVSGGHTQIILIQEDGSAKIIGQTIDDAAGEAFDKAAKILDLGYPGGPLIDKLAKKGNHKAVDFPRPLCTKKDIAKHRFNFSFSGLKTSLYYKVKDQELKDQELLDFVASYQWAIVDVLTRKTLDACKEHGAKNIVVGGGVACNSLLRSHLTEQAGRRGIQTFLTPAKYCSDNAAMIAALGYHNLKNGKKGQGMSLETSPRAEKLAKVAFLK